jgi:uncharacterized membrane protein
MVNNKKGKMRGLGIFVRIILLIPFILGIIAPLLFKIHFYKPSETVYHLLGAICHQAYSRSFWLAGVPIGIYSRCNGIYLGIFLASFSGIINFSSINKYIFSLLLIFPLAIEKIAFGSSLFSNTTRFIIGFFAGYGVGYLLFTFFKELIHSLNIYIRSRKMKKTTVFTVFFLIIFCQLYQSTFAAEIKEVKLLPGTIVILRVNESITGDKSPGTQVNLSVLSDVTKDQYVVIKAGTPAVGSIASSEKAKMIGREGKISITVDRAKTVDGQEVLLQGNMSGTGDDKVVTSVVVSTLLCPLALLMKGGEGEIPTGAEVRSYVANEVIIKFPVK